MAFFRSLSSKNGTNSLLFHSPFFGCSLSQRSSMNAFVYNLLSKWQTIYGYIPYKITKHPEGPPDKTMAKRFMGLIHKNIYLYKASCSFIVLQWLFVTLFAKSIVSIHFRYALRNLLNINVFIYYESRLGIFSLVKVEQIFIGYETILAFHGLWLWL